jgi:hypothetical protein
MTRRRRSAGVLEGAGPVIPLAGPGRRAPAPRDGEIEVRNCGAWHHSPTDVARDHRRGDRIARCFAAAQNVCFWPRADIREVLYLAIAFVINCAVHAS